jgi:serine/threonine protein kinase
MALSVANREGAFEAGASPCGLCRHEHNACVIPQALEHLASSGIVHRDLKPMNVFITGDNVAKVCAESGLRNVKSHCSSELLHMCVGAVSTCHPSCHLFLFPVSA